MGRQGRVLAVIAPVAIGAVMLNGCGILGPQSTFEDDTVLTEQVTSVEIDGSNGSITVRGDAAATEVSMHRRVSHRGSRPDGPSHRIEAGVLVLGGCGRNCSVDYTIDTPAGLPVTGRTSNGAIDVSEVGDVDVRTDNGSLTVDGTSGPVRVRTSNGEVEVTLDTPQDVRAETENGEITATVPDAGYRVSVETDNGSTDVGIADDPDGAHRLELKTDNGSITVQPA